MSVLPPDDPREALVAPLPPLGDEPTVSVVIPALGRVGVAAAIRSALDQPEVTEVVVAAGDEASLTAAREVRDDRVRVVDNPSARTPDALNAAVAASAGQVVVRLDTHARLPAGYVATALETLRDTGAANVGGRQVPAAAGGFARAVAIAMTSRAGAGGAAYRIGGPPGPVDTVYLGAYRREALHGVGGFDPRFTRNQDAELNVRLRRAGWLVWFDPRLAVVYRPRGTVQGLARQYLQYGRWRRLTARTHRGSLAPRQLAAPALVLGLLVAGAASLALWHPLPIVLAAGGYLAVLVAAALVATAPGAPAPPGRAGGRGDRGHVPAVVVALATMHVAWGIGFLLGPPRGTAAVSGPPGRSPGPPGNALGNDRV